MDYVKFFFIGWIIFIFTLPVLLAAQEHPLKFEYSDVRFDYGCSYYEIDNLANFEKLQTLGIDKITNVKGRISNGRWEIRINESYFETIREQVGMDCKKTTTKNLTVYETCTPIIEERQVEKWKWSWIEPYSAKLIKVQLGDVKIRWCADIERVHTESGYFVIQADHIPIYDNIAYEKFAWWDSSYGYRTPIINNFTTAIYPVSVNGTVGINSDIIWAKIDNVSYVYHTETDIKGLLAIANETDENDWYYESNTLGSTTPLDVWNSSRHLGIYHMHDTTSWTNDTSGNEKNLTISGVTVTSSGRFGNAFEWDNVADFLRLSTVDASNYYADIPEISISVWVYWTGVGSDVISQNYPCWLMRTKATNQLNFFMYAAGATCEITSTNVLATNSWVHIVWQWDGTTTRLFVNGVEDAAGACALVQPELCTNGQEDTFPFYIGNADPGNAEGWSGYIDEFRIIDTALSVDEVRQDYYNGLGNMTKLGTEETAPLPAVDLNLTLNGTQGNVSYLSGSVANFTVTGNISALANLTANITGFTDNSSMTPYSHFTAITCTENTTYNITAFIGNSSWVGTNETHFATCYPPPPPPEYGISIAIIEEREYNWFERWLYNRYKEIMRFGFIIGNLRLGGHNITDVTNIIADGNITAENVFIPAYLYHHVNTSIYATTAGLFYNVTFNETCVLFERVIHVCDDATNDTFTIVDNGIYRITYIMSFQDTAPAPDGHISTRLVRNEDEIFGSLLESDTTKQNADTLIPNSNVIVSLNAGDRIQLQFAADDNTIRLGTHTTYGDHADAAIITIRRIA